MKTSLHIPGIVSAAALALFISAAAAAAASIIVDTKSGNLSPMQVRLIDAMAQAAQNIN